MFLLTDSLLESIYHLDFIVFVIVCSLILIVLRMAFIALKSAHFWRSLYERLYIFC